MAIDQTRANNILDYMHCRTTATVLTAPVKIRLASTASNATTPGTEITAGGGYTAGGVAAASFWNAASAGSASNIAFSITNMPTAATISHIDFYDSNGSPIRIEYGALTTPRSTSSGDTLTFSAAAVTSALA